MDCIFCPYCNTRHALKSNNREIKNLLKSIGHSIVFLCFCPHRCQYYARFMAEVVLSPFANAHGYSYYF